jgi:hypothetical protein
MTLTGLAVAIGGIYVGLNKKKIFN